MTKQKERCPKCGNEKIAKANVPKGLPNRYCAICDYEWEENHD